MFQLNVTSIANNELPNTMAVFLNHNIAQYLGRSHPATKQAFIVLGTGLDLRAQAFQHLTLVFRQGDQVRCLLGKDQVDTCVSQIHHHSPECLQSLSVGADGTFIVTAEDLSQTSGWCLKYHLCVTHDESSYDAGLHSMMRILNHYETRPSLLSRNIDNVYRTCMPQIWSNRWNVSCAHMETGDYGYEDRLFTRIADVFTILGLECRINWNQWTSIDGVTLNVKICNVDPDIRLSLTYSCTASINNDVHREEVCASSVDFHWLPPTANGEILSPFGYWSLEAEGSQSQAKYVNYTYLSPLQAQLVACFSDCLQVIEPPGFDGS
ncbi:hypothetical protein CERSUDRAFT_61329 [Gelatoporia subvermispora B]|uniref:Uncharacterized protein n=1 Tax=Ceriporiopsis subvermispora (strain B) TaxID=914234 RepID=M2RS02_CERS8|nr:hypothetical protein CERSUDRAFT_61329 [Gelatoporia subvermispora B]